MARLFISLYLFITLSLIGLSAGLERILFDSDDLHTNSHYQQILQAAANQHINILPLVQALNLSTNTILISDMAWPNKDQQALAQGKILKLVDLTLGEQLYFQIDNEQLLEISLPNTHQDNQQFFIYSSVFFLLLGGVIALWIWPLWRDLSALQRNVSQLMPDGNIQANEISKHSLVFPIAKAINQMQQRIRELMQNQRELSSAVAHEFRTPLARLKFALAMQQDMPEDLKQDMKQDISELEKLVQEMLDYASTDIQQPELNLAEIPVTALCQQVIQQVKVPYLAHLNIELKGDGGYILADEHFIHRALSNVLVNAGRYAKKQITVSVKHTTEQIQICIEDDGQGVPNDMREKVFIPFFRPDESRNRNQGGAGLGLAIVKRIMKWHQGFVYVTESELGGAKFIMELNKPPKT